MSQDKLIALNDRWRDRGHPYAEKAEGDLWILRCPLCPPCEDQGDLVGILSRAINHRRAKHI